MVVACLCFMKFVGSPKTSAELGLVKSLPFSVQNIQGKHRPPSAAEVKGLPEDTHIQHAIYFDSKKGNYYDTGLVIAGKHRHSLHPPNECMVAAGWTILTTSEAKIKRYQTPYNVNILHLKRENENGKVTYAYYIYAWVCAKRITAQYSNMLIYNIADSIQGSTYRWAYPSTMLFQKEDESASKTLNRGLDFFADYLDQMMSHALRNELDQ